MVYMEQRHDHLRKDTRKFTSVILYMNIICIEQWLFDANFEILHCSGAFARRYKHSNPECSFMQTCRLFFIAKIWRHFSITSQLR